MPLTTEPSRITAESSNDSDEQVHNAGKTLAQKKGASRVSHAGMPGGMTALLIGAGGGAIVTLIALSVVQRDTPNEAGARPHQPPVAVFGGESRQAVLPLEHRPLQPVEEVPRDLADTLRRCLRSSEAGCYAPVLESFHRQLQMPRWKAVEQKRRLRQLYPTVRKDEISNLRLESLIVERAIVSFDREWDMAGERRYAGAARQRVAAVKMLGGWQIVREEELQVYWTRRG